MKKQNLAVSVLLSLAAAVLFSGCYEPSPLYGTWKDNQGDKITFINDGTYNASIYDEITTSKKTYEGDYSVIENVLSFSIKADSSNVVTEWDIRGSMLYLTWTSADIVNKSLTLYHTSK